MSERIWFNDIPGFMTQHNYNKFFPSKDMTFAEQLNSLLRFAIYFSILIFVLKRDTNVFFVLIFMAGFTYILYTIDTQNKIREKFYIDSKGLSEDKETKKLCTAPTKENPFMNVLMSDYAENPQKKEACDVSKGKTKKLVKKYFNNNLYRDVSDVYNKNASDRNYYTMPISTIPNDQESFAKYLYGQDKTCKEGAGEVCHKNVYRALQT